MSKPKLLVVDDEEAIRNQMGWALNDDYEVLLAEDRASAIAQMRKEHPELVALDLGLPPRAARRGGRAEDAERAAGDRPAGEGGGDHGQP
jgi:DNA-binding response OmpR family regulator